jgi:hypothetical protein
MAGNLAALDNAAFDLMIVDVLMPARAIKLRLPTRSCAWRSRSKMQIKASRHSRILQRVAVGVFI